MKRYYLQLIQQAYSDAEMATGLTIQLDLAHPSVRSALATIKERVRSIVGAVKDDIAHARDNAQERALSVAAQETDYIYSLGLRMAYEQIGLEVEDAR